MRSSTKDMAEGSMRQLKGIAKQIFGTIVNSSNLQAQGKGENTSGRIQKKIGQVERAEGR